ncbi:MAG: toxin [Cutibacterium sp.]|nr:toxin [Cutibacterium sp.]
MVSIDPVSSKEPDIQERARGQSQKAPPGNEFITPVPKVSLPKGGGAISGIGEKFTANPVTGTGSMAVPIATSPGRAGFGPQLSLSYDSGTGNGPFGLGWSLSIPSITRKTDKGLPQYLDTEDSDTFILAGAEDLVPLLTASGERAPDETVKVYGQDYRVRRYRPRIEGLFAHIERWSSSTSSSVVFWRTISRDNITSWYGRSAESRVFDPEDPTHIFQWYLCETYDDKGNATVYSYKPEDGAGVDPNLVFESNRSIRSRHAATYLTSIHYGNRTPFLPTLAASGAWQEAPTERDAWMFEVLLDYGDLPAPDPSINGALQPEIIDRGVWQVREDPFSAHRAGFEIRTWRLCHRVLMLHHFPGEATAGPHCLVKSTDFSFEKAKNTLLLNPEESGYAVLRKVTHHSYQRRQPHTPASIAPLPGYEWRSLPSVEFTYSVPKINTTVRRIAASDLPNLPVGTQGPGFQWVDLNGEGMSGVLTEQGGAWYYAPNRGGGRFAPPRIVAPVPAMASLASGRQQLMDLGGDGEIDLVDFSSPTPGFHERDSDLGWKRHIPFVSLPNIDWQDPNLRFVDLTGDGHADALISEDEVFAWYPSLDERGFAPALRQRQATEEAAGPRLVFNDGTQTLFLADMCGDGLTDLVRIRNGEVCYWPNQGYGRFGRKVVLANAPIFEASDLFDPARIRLADIDGSGPIDIIYLGRNGAQLYFNRSGNSLSDARLVPLPTATANLGAVQVADLLGRGTACLVWNSHLPADASHPVRYIDLMADGKPHLLTRTINNLGGSTEITYTPSTRFYLDDLAAGRPWVTRLPFPVHCVSKVTIRDAWRGTEFSSTYSYHHGYFDGAEREFRGFGRVEQLDLDAYGTDANIDSPWVTDDQRLFQPPIKTVTWYHVGASIDRQRILGHFSEEYFPQRYADRLPKGSSLFRELDLPEPELPTGLNAQEWREALRACKGMVLRQESYELDLDELLSPAQRQREVRLYSVATHNCKIQRLQPIGANRHAVFLVTENEAITYHHELVIPSNNSALQPDPRIAHTLNLRHDEFGNVEQAVAIGYPRWTPGSYPDVPDPARIEAVQKELHVAYTETRTTNDALLAARDNDTSSPLRHHRLRLPCETRTYEITGLEPPTSFYFDIDTLRRHKLSEDQQRFPATGPQASQLPVGNLLYQQQATTNLPHRRIIEHQRALFFNDSANNTPPTGPLPFGQLGPRGLKYEDYRLALTNALLTAVFGDKLDWVAEAASPGTPIKTCRNLLEESSRSGYVPGTSPGLDGTADQFWMRSGIAGFAADAHQHFYLPERYTDPFGYTTTLRFDPLDLYIAESVDARKNTTTVHSFDYRVLAPTELVDANGNHTEVTHDLLGMVVAMAVKGKKIQDHWQADHLDGWDFDQRNPAVWAIRDFCHVYDVQEQTARGWLGSATARFVYHFGGPYDTEGRPMANARMASVCAIRRETHKDPQTLLQIALECSDGSGAVLMQKVQAEPDPAIPNKRRWLVNGLTLVNNKGKPVKQYEPTFSASFGCELPQANGVSTTNFYDAAGRVVRTEMPDGTFNRVEFSPWDSTSWDANDTVKESRWYRERLTAAERGPGAPTGSAEHELAAANASQEAKRAARLAAQHAETPVRTLFDSLGREVISVVHNRTPDANGVWQSQKNVTFTKLDAEGKPLWIRDALGHLVMQYIAPPRATDAAGEAMPGGAAPCYDMAGNLLFQHSMDAGLRWSLNDAAGKPLFGWDIYRAVDKATTAPQKRLYRTDYDALHRPVRQWLKVDADAPRLIEAFDYCDGAAPHDANNTLTLIEAQSRNLIGQTVRHFDPSGLVTLERLDLSGQPKHLTRRLIKVVEAQDNEPALDWNVSTAEREALLESATAETFRQFTEYDALGRMKRLVNWHQPQFNRVAVYVPRYNARGILESEMLHLRAAVAVAPDGDLTISISAQPAHNQQAISSIRYNAKGQKELLQLGNGTVSTYTYDPQTFRLTSIRTHRTTTPRGLQDLAYTYDPIGNITTLIDHAQETVFTNNTMIEPKNEYIYDALYRLVQAKGRENEGSNGVPAADEGPWPRESIPTGIKMRGYTQTYRYDAVGNFQMMRHVPTQGTGWTRYYAYAFDDLNQSASNRLWRTWTNGTVWDGARADSVTYLYDSHGSMLNLNRVSVPPPQAEDWGHQITWDWRDMMSRFDAIGGGWARYHYGIDKQRTRKNIMRNGGGIEDRIYLGGFELYRRYNSLGDIVEKIETHHLFEGEQRVLLVDDVLFARDQPGPRGTSLTERTCWRYQYGNHLGSVALELDEAAQIISYEEFHPYGTSAFRLMRTATEAPAKRYSFTGMEKDEESGLSYHFRRIFFVHICKWISSDDPSSRDGLNYYCYARNNPINRKDTNGAQSTNSNRSDEDIRQQWSPKFEKRLLEIMVNDYEHQLRAQDAQNQKRYDNEFIHWRGRFDPMFPREGDPEGRFYQGLEDLKSFREELGWKQKNIADPALRIKSMYREYRHRMTGGFERGLILAAVASSITVRISNIGLLNFKNSKSTTPQADKSTTPQAENSTAPQAEALLTDAQLVAKAEELYVAAITDYLRAAGKPVTQGLINFHRQHFTVGILQGTKPGGEVVTLIAVNNPDLFLSLERVAASDGKMVMNDALISIGKRGYPLARMTYPHAEMPLAAEKMTKELTGARVASSNPGCWDCQWGMELSGVRHVNPAPVR